jgi:hypothetical protein
VKKLLLLVSAAGALLAFRKRKAAQSEADLWHEATTAPDLR